jgi:hypothetical protein
VASDAAGKVLSDSLRWPVAAGLWRRVNESASSIAVGWPVDDEGLDREQALPPCGAKGISQGRGDRPQPMTLVSSVTVKKYVPPGRNYADSEPSGKLSTDSSLDSATS